MADKPLFNLDTKGRWRLAYDVQQRVIQCRDRPPCAYEAPANSAAQWPEAA